MAAALAYRFPALLLERSDQLGAGDDRQALAHAEIGSLRRTTPLSLGRPSSRSPSMYNSSASRALSVAASLVGCVRTISGTVGGVVDERDGRCRGEGVRHLGDTAR